MQVGIYMDLRNPPRWERPWNGFYQGALEQIEEAERLGIDAVWFSEHHFWEDAYLPQPMTFAAAAAARTKRIRVGTAIVLSSLKHATDVAEQAAVIDLISGGRFELGIGAGYVIPEFKAFGADPKRRFEAMEHLAAEVRRLWAEKIVTPQPLQERMPIWIGGMGPRSARMAGRLGERLMWPGRTSLEVYLEALAANGHDPADGRIGGLVQFVIADDPEAAWAQIAPHVAYQWGTYGYYGGLDTDAPGMGLLPDLAITGVDPEAMRKREGLPLAPNVDVVTPDEAVRRLTENFQGMPVEHIFCWTSIAGMPDDLVNRHIELLSSEVAPRVRDVGIPAP